MAGATPDIVLFASVACRGRVRLPGEMNRDQKTVAAVVRKFVVLAFEFFVFALPHAKSVVRLRRPILQGLNDDLAVRIVTLVLLQNHFSSSVVHLRAGHSGLFVHVPGEALRIHVKLLPFEWV